MSRSPRPSRSVAVLAAAVVAITATPALASPPAPAEPPRFSFEVFSAKLYVDSAGAAKGTMQARVRALYRFAPALPGEHWIGVTTIILRGPGGSKTVRDRDRLTHLAHGQPVDHRVAISPAEASRLLGSKPASAKVRVRVWGHLELQGHGANEALHVTPSWGPVPLFGGVVTPVSVATMPLPAQVWGEGQLEVQVTDNPPFRRFVAYAYAQGVPVVPDRLTNLDPTSGFIQADNSFQVTGILPIPPCSSAPTATGTVPPGANPTGPAVFTVQSCTGTFGPNTVWR